MKGILHYWTPALFWAFVIWLVWSGILGAFLDAWAGEMLSSFWGKFNTELKELLQGLLPW